MAPRKPRTPEAMAESMLMASNAIPGEPNWPPSAPTAAQCGTHAVTLSQRIIEIETLKAQLDMKRQELEADMEAAGDDWVKNDDATTLLYGKFSANKDLFGTPAYKEPQPMGEPEQVLIEKLSDGSLPHSFKALWKHITGCSYEVQWSADISFTNFEGSTTTTASEATFQVNQQGVQYFVRVRAVRGSLYGPWSDPATRVANV